ncbi:hypothetical protein ACLMJK_004477 [Lecanora helva]
MAPSFHAQQQQNSLDPGNKDFNTSPKSIINRTALQQNSPISPLHQHPSAHHSPQNPPIPPHLSPFTITKMPAPTPCPSPSRQSTTTTTNGTTRPSTTSTQPPNWTPAMTRFTRDCLARGEDAKSTIILLETEFPNMRDRVGEAWVEGLRGGK